MVLWARRNFSRGGTVGLRSSHSVDSTFPMRTFLITPQHPCFCRVYILDLKCSCRSSSSRSCPEFFFPSRGRSQATFRARSRLFSMRFKGLQHMMTTKCNLRQLSAVLFSTAVCVVLCVGILGAAPRSKKDKNSPPVPAAGDSSAIPATFFSMNNVDPRDPVRVPIGTQGHPSALVWGWVGREKGRYDWSVFDMFVKDAPKDQNGVAQIVLTLGK